MISKASVIFFFILYFVLSFWSSEKVRERERERERGERVKITNQGNSKELDEVQKGIVSKFGEGENEEAFHHFLKKKKKSINIQINEKRKGQSWFLLL